MAKGKGAKIGRAKKEHGKRAKKDARSLQIKKILSNLQGVANPKHISTLLMINLNLNCDNLLINEVRPLFDLNSNEGLVNESLDSFNERMKGALEIRTTDEKWYLSQLAKVKDRVSR